jgi:hypothetical protein
MNTIAQLKKAMPSGIQKAYDGFIWHKRGGHAGTRMIQTSKDKFTKLGFSSGPFGSSQFQSPDGSVVGNDSVLFDKEGNRVEFIESYGVSQEYNRYSISLTFLKEYRDKI